MASHVWRFFKGFWGGGQDNPDDGNGLSEDTTGGFKVKRVVSHPTESGPVIMKTNEGGVQGLSWYTNSLKVDEDEDVAHEFFEESPVKNNRSELVNRQDSEKLRQAIPSGPMTTKDGHVVQQVQAP